jgi:hypothetical protein
MLSTSSEAPATIIPSETPSDVPVTNVANQTSVQTTTGQTTYEQTTKLPITTTLIPITTVSARQTQSHPVPDVIKENMNCEFIYRPHEDPLSRIKLICQLAYPVNEKI